MLRTIRKTFFGGRTRKQGKSPRKPRRLAYEPLECRQMMSANPALNVSCLAKTLEDPALCRLVRADFKRDGAIARNDMLGIFQLVEGNGTTISAADGHDLKILWANAAELKMPAYVQVLTGDVINDNNPADAHYQGAALGKLKVGGPTSVLADLVNKWFLGLDLPSIQGAYVKGSFSPASKYSSPSDFSSDPLFSSSGPSYKDLEQGALGDCYFVSALGTIADASPQAIENMFLKNGDGTYTVRFFAADGKADYVTVNTALPLSAKGRLEYERLGTDNSLWLALAEKAYAEWDETGDAGRGNVNAYENLAGGKSLHVFEQTLDAYGQAQDEKWTSSATAAKSAALESDLINALGSPANAVTISTINTLGDPDQATGLYPGHCYVVLGYNATQQTFQLYNPWGHDQPVQNLTWSQLAADCKHFDYVNAVPGPGPIAGPIRRPF